MTPRREVDLSSFNTLAVPARARYYAEVAEREALPELLAFARRESLPVLVLGGGSNIVLSGDYPGLVLHLRLSGRELLGQDEAHYWLRVGAGENWHALVGYCLERGYWGLENLSLIPGSVGAAPIQNIGAYGVELKDLFVELEAMDRQSGAVHTFDREACAFGYRDSFFKREGRDRYVILSVTLRLWRRPHLTLTYPSLREALADTPADALTPQQVSDAVCAIRRSKLPDPGQLPNVGSFFKNPVVSREQFEQLEADHPGLVAYPDGAGRVKLAAGWLIERAGWKGVQRGPVAVHEHQALVLTNPGRAPGRELLALAEAIRESVAQQYGVELEPEPRFY